MPAKSRKQQRYLFAQFGAAWVRRHHFDRLAHEKARKGAKTLREASRKR